MEKDLFLAICKLMKKRGITTFDAWIDYMHQRGFLIARMSKELFEVCCEYVLGRKIKYHAKSMQGLVKSETLMSENGKINRIIKLLRKRKGSDPDIPKEDLLLYRIWLAKEKEEKENVLREMDPDTFQGMINAYRGDFETFMRGYLEGLSSPLPKKTKRSRGDIAGPSSEDLAGPSSEDLAGPSSVKKTKRSRGDIAGPSSVKKTKRSRGTSE